MWLGNHLPHYWNEVFGWAATYLISEMLYVDGRTLTQFLGAVYIYIYIYVYIYIIIVKKLAYFFRKIRLVASRLWFFVREYHVSKTINFSFRKSDLPFRNSTFNKKVNYLLENIFFPLAKMIFNRTDNYLFRKYDFFVRYITFPWES